MTIAIGSPTSHFLPPQPCDPKSGNAGFWILLEVGNEAGSLSTVEVRNRLPQGANGFPDNKTPKSIIQVQHTRCEFIRTLVARIETQAHALNVRLQPWHSMAGADGHLRLECANEFAPMGGYIDPAFATRSV